MGWGAAQALAAEWAEWCSGPEEAYEILYGDPKPLWRCPICNRKCKGEQAVRNHARDKHTKPKHIAIMREWKP